LTRKFNYAQFNNYEIESVESNFVKMSRSNSSKFIFQNAHSDGPV